MIKIEQLHVESEGKKILKGVSLEIKPGEIHAIMGPNGTGKSTLSRVIAGDPVYQVTSGDILFEGKSILELEPEERAHLGVFVSFQYPPEITGVHNAQFLQASLQALYQAKGQEKLSDEAFNEYLKEKMSLIGIKDEFMQRGINEDFSGGEKKRNEILQMAVLDPKFSVLDETDSGLDIDALKIVAEGVNRLVDTKKSLLLITHYQRLLNYIQPHFVHIMVNGKIVASGGRDLALTLEEKGYDHYLGSSQEVSHA